MLWPIERRFTILGNCVRAALQNTSKVVVSCTVLMVNDEFDHKDINIIPNEIGDEEQVICHEKEFCYNENE